MRQPWVWGLVGLGAFLFLSCGVCVGLYWLTQATAPPPPVALPPPQPAPVKEVQPDPPPRPGPGR